MGKLWGRNGFDSEGIVKEAGRGAVGLVKKRRQK